MSGAAPAPRPGYLVVRAEEGGAYLGGLMVTDEHGLPLDFRYTDPVRPTRLQRALYGGVLDRYLRGEVVLRTLLGDLERPPSLLLVDDPALLDERVDGCPLAHVAATRAGPLGPPGARAEQGRGSFLLQAAEGAAPLRVALAEGAGDAADRVAEALVALAASMDPLEPAERVRDALEVIAAGDADA